MIKNLVLVLLCAAGVFGHAQNLQSDKEIKDSYFFFLDNRHVNDRILINDSIKNIPLSSILAPYVGHQLHPVDDPFNDSPELADQLFKSFILYDLFFFKPQNESAALSKWPDNDVHNNGNSNPSELEEYLNEIFGAQPTRKTNFDQLSGSTAEGSSGHSADISSFMSSFATEYQNQSLGGTYLAEGQALLLGPARYDGASIRSIKANSNEVYSLFGLFSTLESCSGNCIQIGLEFFDSNGEEITSPPSVKYNMPGSKNRYSNQGGGNFSFNIATHSYNTVGLTPATAGTWRDKCKTFKCPAGTAFMDIHIFTNGLNDNWTTPVHVDQLHLIKHAFVADNDSDYSFPVINLSDLPANLSSIAGITVNTVNAGFIGGVNSTCDETSNLNADLPWQASKLERRNQVYADRTPFATAMDQALLYNDTYEPVDLFMVMPRMDYSFQHSSAELNAYFDLIDSTYTTWSSSTANQSSLIQIGGIYICAEDQNDLSTSEISMIKTTLDLWNTSNNRQWKLYASPYANVCTSCITANDLDYLPFVSRADSAWQAQLDGIWQQPNAFAKPQASNNFKTTDQELLKSFNQFMLEHPSMGGNMELDYYDHITSPHANVNIDPQPYAGIIDYFSYGKKYGFVNNYKTFIDNAGLYYLLANLDENATGHLANIKSSYHQLCHYLNAGNTGMLTNGNFETNNLQGEPYAWTLSGATAALHSGNQIGNIAFGNQYLALKNQQSATTRNLQIGSGDYKLRFLARSSTGLGSLQIAWGNNSESVSIANDWTEYEINLPNIELRDALTFTSAQDVDLDGVEYFIYQSYINQEWNEEFPLVIEANPDQTYFGAFSEWLDLDSSEATLKLNFDIRSESINGSTQAMEVHLEFKDQNNNLLSSSLVSSSSANISVAHPNLVSQVDSGNYVILNYQPHGNANGNGCGSGINGGLDQWESRWIHNKLTFNVPFEASAYRVKFRASDETFMIIMEDNAHPVDTAHYGFRKNLSTASLRPALPSFRDGDPKLTKHELSLNEDIKIRVYPIPSNDQITIGLSSGTFERRKLQIIDGSGKVVLTSFTGNLQTQKFLDISSLAEGVYTVILTSDEDMIRESFLVR